MAISKQRDRLNRDEYYLEMLKLVASRGTCIRRQVGAIIVDIRGHVLSTGYNGVPAGFPHCGFAKLGDHGGKICEGAGDPPGDSRRCLAVHAEQNALMQCIDLNRAHTFYVSCTPCFGCAKMIANTSIKQVVCIEKYADSEGMAVLEAAGIAVSTLRQAL